MQEKFSVLEAVRLRNDLLLRGLDSFEVANVIKMFLAERGYGASAEMARDVATEIETIANTVECFRQGLETLGLPI